MKREIIVVANDSVRFLLTHLSVPPWVQHWSSVSHSLQRRSCTACTEQTCLPECVWCSTPGPPGAAESIVAGWRSRPVAPEVELSGSPDCDLRAKRGFVFCSLKTCKNITPCFWNNCLRKKNTIIVHNWVQRVKYEDLMLSCILSKWINGKSVRILLKQACLWCLIFII